MSERTDEQIADDIRSVLEKYVAPAVAGHGGQVNFLEYSNGKVLLELSGACSGCAGSTMTLKFGVESMLKEMIPEVQEVEGMDDPMSTVAPYMTNPFYMDDMLDMTEDLDETDH